MRMLVTGGAGFVGSYLVKELVNRGDEVIAFDNFDPYYSARFKKLNIVKLLENNNFKLIQGDIRNYREINEAMKDVDIVFHLAARPGVLPALRKPRVYHAINVDGTFNVLMAAMRNSIKRFVFASSSSVYGAAKYLPMDENHLLDPTSAYGTTKIIGEEYCLLFDRVHGLETNILRYFSVVGPAQRPDLVISEWTNKIFKKQKVDVKGLTQARDFTYVGDVVRATILAAEKDVHGEIFNIGGGSKVPIKYILEKLIELTSFKNVKVVDLGIREGDRPETQADNSKAGKILGWKPEVKIDEILEEYVRWYKNTLT